MIWRKLRFFCPCQNLSHRIHGAAIYGVPWIPSIYPLYVSIYSSTMDPTGMVPTFQFSIQHWTPRNMTEGIDIHSLNKRRTGHRLGRIFQRIFLLGFHATQMEDLHHFISTCCRKHFNGLWWFINYIRVSLHFSQVTHWIHWITKKIMTNNYVNYFDNSSANIMISASCFFVFYGTPPKRYKQDLKINIFIHK